MSSKQGRRRRIMYPRPGLVGALVEPVVRAVILRHSPCQSCVSRGQSRLSSPISRATSGPWSGRGSCVPSLPFLRRRGLPRALRTLGGSVKGRVGGLCRNWHSRGPERRVLGDFSKSSRGTESGVQKRNFIKEVVQ